MKRLFKTEKIYFLFSTEKNCYRLQWMTGQNNSFVCCYQRELDALP